MYRDELHITPPEQTLDQDDPVTQSPEEVSIVVEADPTALPLTEEKDREASIYGVNPDKPLSSRKILNPDS